MKAQKPSSKSEALNDIKNCCASDVGLSGFTECQMSGPNSCPYALAFGYSFLCQHPRVSEILEQSKAKRAEIRQ